MRKGATAGSGPVASRDLFGPPGIPPPDFEQLLLNPLVREPVEDFDVKQEAAHLLTLWERHPKLQRHVFVSFVAAGGSGMVFKVLPSVGSSTPRALKIARHKLFAVPAADNVATALSPVSEGELRTLEQLSHPNVVRLYDAIDDDGRVFAISTTYVDSPLNLDHYLRATLKKPPGKKSEVAAFSPRRLDDACSFLIARFSEVAAALQHLHHKDIYHFDVKPANILVSKTAKNAVLTDMGSCIHTSTLATSKRTRVHFTWTYAHPDLHNLIKEPTGLRGGGLKASAAVESAENLARYDLFALGRTIQEILALLDHEFEELCYSSYGFRFLHLLSCLLLDGRNTPAGRRVTKQDHRRFVDDVAMGYPKQLFATQKLNHIDQVVERLQRFTRAFSWNDTVRELDPWQPDVINTGGEAAAPFTARIAAITKHPAFARLKHQGQLGWVTEVYPGATHTRWSHSIGVMSFINTIYSALLADPEVPTFRLLAEPADIEHALLAGLLHDLGQSTFGHDFEIAAPKLFAHEKFVARALRDGAFGLPTLQQTLERHWPRTSVSRVIDILSAEPQQRLPIDGIARDLINGPIDADKLDYLRRDSTYSGVPYGLGPDVPRFIRALSVSARADGQSARLGLAFRAKGRTAVEAVLISRYQMYGAVYWHHTYRCIQAMFAHAAIETFGAFESGSCDRGGATFSPSDIEGLYYHVVIAGRPWPTANKLLKRAVPKFLLTAPPEHIQREAALDFLYRFSSPATRSLIVSLSRRDLYKRVFETRMSELPDDVEYADMKNEFIGQERTRKATALQQSLMDLVGKRMAERRESQTTTAAENAAQKRFNELRAIKAPLVVLDFPTRGVASEKNLPHEIGDAYRKYFTMPSTDKDGDSRIFTVIRRLQTQMAAMRVFAAPAFHELVIRYLNPDDVRDCVDSVVPIVKR